MTILTRKIKFLLLPMMTAAILLAGCGQKKENVMQTGMTALDELRYEDAVTSFTAAGEEKNADQEQVNRALGIAYMGMTQYEQAIEAFTKALSSGSSTPLKIDYDINYYVAICYYKLDQYDAAKERYDAIIALKPKERDALYLRGIIFLKKNAFESATADFDAALAAGKTDYSLYIDIYSALAGAGYKDAGRVYLETAMENGKDSMSDYDRGRMYFYLENYEYARNYLEKARSGKVFTADVALMLGQAYEALNDRNYAITVYEAYLAESENAGVYNQLGLCKMSLSDYEGALQSFQKGLEMDDKNYRQTLNFNEVVAYEDMSNFEQARNLLTEYLTLYPDDETAKREYEFLKTR